MNGDQAAFPLAASASRVLHVIAGLEVGGAELMLQRLIDGNRNSAVVRHEVVSLTTGGTVGARLVEQGVVVHALGMQGIRSVLPSLLKLRRLIRELRPDVVQTWMYHADFLGGLAARLAGHRRIVWGVRATNVSSEGVSKTVWLRRICAPLSHWIPEAIICAAQASRIAHEQLGYDASRMVVIPNGFDCNALKQAGDARDAQRAALGIAAGTVLVGAVGRFNAVKDYHSLVEAAALVRDSGHSVRFLLVGRGVDQHNAQLTGWIADARLQDHFILAGERDDVPRYMAALDIFCLSSSSEGFPNVVGEAMCVGIPCVVTDVGDAAMLVGETGITVPARNPAALAEGMLQLVQLPDVERRARGIAAQRRMESNFSMDVARQRFLQVYGNQRVRREEFC